MITDSITQKIGEALKAHDEARLSTLRLLSSALSYEKIAKQHVLTSDEELTVVRKEVKKRKDAIEMYGKAGEQDKTRANEKIANEEIELKILSEYLPPDMDDLELEKLVLDVISEMNVTDPKEMGKVIGAVKAKTEGRADGSKIASLVKQNLTK